MSYKLTVSEIEVESKVFTTYGIAGEHMSFLDVSTNKEKVEEMIDRITSEELEECHLMEFIADELIK